MRCKKCGYEVDNDKAFCPVCGTTMKVTPDYDYIQAEIATKVDKYIDNNSTAELNMIGGGSNLRDDLGGRKKSSSSRTSKTTASKNRQSVDLSLLAGRGAVVSKSSDSKKTVIDLDALRNLKNQDSGETEEYSAPKNFLDKKKNEAAGKKAGNSVFDEFDDELTADVIDDFDDYDDYDDHDDHDDKHSRSRSSGRKSDRHYDDRYDDDYYDDGYYDDDQDDRRKNRRDQRADNRRYNDPYNDRNYVNRRRKNSTASIIITIVIILLIIFAAVFGILTVLGTFNKTSTTGSSGLADNAVGTLEEDTRDKVTCNLDNGEFYDDPVTVTLESSQGNRIFYTIDGSDPSISSAQYTGEFTITAADVPNSYPSVNLRAVSYSASSIKSGEMDIVFNIGGVDAMAPTISPMAGTFSSSTEIVVTSVNGGKIYYTYDGTTPTEDSTLYTGPIRMLPGTNTFQAVSVNDGTVSAVSSAVYTLNIDVGISSDSAMDSARYALIDYGYSYDYDGDLNDGGYAKFTNLGIYDIGAYSYYIIQVDMYSSDGTAGETIYFGIGVNYGSVYWVTKTGDSFYVE